ncbi:Fungal specific transcription factor domain-containing protein 13 [Elsinoe fawcettii]|nr:Fungal specific transcription factor domain-containing protein 13 [Elsinoe fawcettii]
MAADLFDDGSFDVNIFWALNFMPTDDMDPMQTELQTGHVAVDDTQTSQPRVLERESAACSPLHGWPDRTSRQQSPQQTTADADDLASIADVISRDSLALKDRYEAVLQNVSIDLFPAKLDSVRQVLTAETPQNNKMSIEGAESAFDRAVCLYFLQLYFVFVQPRFPVIHTASFSVEPTRPELLLAMLLQGATQSRHTSRKLIMRTFHQVHDFLLLNHSKDLNYFRDTENVFALLLVSSVAVWSGDKAAFEKAENTRGLIALACKRSRLLDSRAPSSSHRGTPFEAPSSRNLQQTWRQWISDEQQKRLGLCMFLFDCQFSALLNAQPYIGKAATVHAVLPCADMYWQAPKAQAWKILLGPSETPPCTYFLTTLNSILLYGASIEAPPFPPLDDFGRMLFAYVLHTHVFEWHQALCMLNPNGLVRSVLAFSPQDIGSGLAERKTWLDAALNNWNANYGMSTTTFASTDQKCSQLLFYLAQLALRVSFSDLHLVTGRSGSEEDIFLAEEALQNWLRKDDTEATVLIATQMLDLAHDMLRDELSCTWSSELAVCLFMGGLICWACCRLCTRTDQLAGNPIVAPAWLAGYDDHLTTSVQKAAKALKSLWQCRLSVFFGSVLDYFYNDLARRSGRTAQA